MQVYVQLIYHRLYWKSYSLVVVFESLDQSRKGHDILLTFWIWLNTFYINQWTRLFLIDYITKESIWHLKECSFYVIWMAMEGHKYIEFLVTPFPINKLETFENSSKANATKMVPIWLLTFQPNWLLTLNVTLLIGCIESLW